MGITLHGGHNTYICLTWHTTCFLVLLVLCKKIIYIYIYIVREHRPIWKCKSKENVLIKRFLVGIYLCYFSIITVIILLSKLITSDLCALWKLAFCKWTTHYCTIPKKHKITFTDFFINCSHLVEWPAQLNPSSWILTHLQETAKNTSLPSLFDPLTLYSNSIWSVFLFKNNTHIWPSINCIYVTLSVKSRLKSQNLIMR